MQQKKGEMGMNPLNDMRIIIIDDNPEIHKDFIKVLSFDNASNPIDAMSEQLFADTETKKMTFPKFIIDCASQGQEGVACIKQALDEGKPYAVAFVDIRMPPGWDGIETIQHIWKLDTDIQVVICTAFSDYTWEETIEKLGMTDNLLILKKPFDIVAVRQLACALAKKWQLMHEARFHTQFLEESVEQRTLSLQKSLSLIRATLESSGDGIVVVDNEGMLVDFNNHFVEMWEMPSVILDSKKSNLIFEYIQNQLLEADVFQDRVKYLHDNPEEIISDILKLKDNKVYEEYSQPHKLNGVTIGRVWSFHNITKRVYLEQQLEYQATHDSLTNLPNRLLLTDRIHQKIEEAARHKFKVAILFFDLDRFKLVNDSLSHSVGDKLLQAVANRLNEAIRKEDTLARLGGDEFVFVTSLGDNPDNNVLVITAKLAACFNKPFDILEHHITISTSIGISIYPDDGTTIEELLRNADLAMYHAKELGSNQFQFYKQEMNELAMQRLENESELRHAIENKELFLCYQPQYDVQTKKILAVEALVRWRHPKKGIILPLDFIPIAEESGLIIPLGEWVLRTACEQNKAWQDQGLFPIRVAVNVSSRQFRQPNLVKTIANILKETGLKPEYLEIEVTENVIINNAEVVKLICELKEMGVQIVLDDFGTGNSSLNYLKQIPVDRLKIDQSFVQNIDLNRSDEVIIHAIIAMANSLNIPVLAEGVETKGQLKFLQDENCNDIQGFFFSKPLEEKAMGDLLLKHD